MTAKNQLDAPVAPDLALITTTLKIIGGKWRLYTLLVLGEQTLRYNQLGELIPGISPKVLAGELKTLVALGVIQRDVYAQVPARVEYKLTPKGRLALPGLRALPQIGQLFT